MQFTTNEDSSEELIWSLILKNMTFNLSKGERRVQGVQKGSKDCVQATAAGHENEPQGTKRDDSSASASHASASKRKRQKITKTNGVG